MLLSLFLACSTEYYFHTTLDSTWFTPILLPKESTFILNWEDEGLSVEINEDESFILGLVETGDAYDPWTGEDCLNGYFYDGDILLYCHPLEPGLNWFFDNANPLDLNVATETVFTQAMSNELTYIIWSTVSDNCWVWGNDPHYYREEFCLEISQSIHS